MKKIFTTMLLVCAAVMGLQAQDVWILGTIGDQNWDPSVGTKMTLVSGDEYTLTVPIYANSYFSFTTALAETSTDWDAIKPYRFGASANDFEITDDLLGEPIQCGALGESSDNAFKTVSSAYYKITLFLTDRLVMFENVGELEDKPDSLRVDGSIYMLGDIAGAGWVTNNGLKMNANGNTHTANITITPNDQGVGYFGFTKGLSTTQNDNWTMIAPYRFAAVDAESQAVVLDTATPLSADGEGNNSFYLPGGNYIVTLDMDARTMTVTADNANHMYIIGNAPFGEWNPSAPAVMDETESGSGVFTCKATFEGDKWFIFSDARGSWEAVNEFRYGPLDEENDEVIAIGVDVTTQLTTGGKSYKVTGDGSEYTITFNKNNLTFKFEATSPDVKGDVSGNGTVDVGDINILINIMLGKDNASNYNGRANVDGKGDIDVADINAIINAMLGK